MPGGVALVHLEQVAGEQVRLFTPLGAADLDDDVLVVVGIGRQQQHPQLGLQRGHQHFGRVDLGAQRVPLVGVGIGIQLLRRRHVALGLLVPAVDGDDRLELLVPPRQLPERALVRRHVRLGQPFEDVGVFAFQRVKSFEHR